MNRQACDRGDMQLSVAGGVADTVRRLCVFVHRSFNHPRQADSGLQYFVAKNGM
jgi:hypothetical protein